MHADAPVQLSSRRHGVLTPWTASIDAIGKAADRSVVAGRDDSVVSRDDRADRCLSTVTPGGLIDGHRQEVLAGLGPVVFWRRHGNPPNTPKSRSRVVTGSSLMRAALLFRWWSAAGYACTQGGAWLAISNPADTTHRRFIEDEPRQA